MFISAMPERWEPASETVRRGFGAAQVLVVGDLMLDRYLWGEVDRISPEAPVPVVRLTREATHRPGGAANVAANLAGLGLQVSVAGFVGADPEGNTDPEGEQLLALLEQLGAGVEAVVRSAKRRTVTKIRVMGGHNQQQMLRLDQEDSTAPSEDDVNRLQEAILLRVQARPGAVVLSDYAKGALGAQVCRAVIAEARSLGIPVLVDPKGADYTKYTGATAITPNRAELAFVCRVSSGSIDELLKAGEQLRERLELDFLAFTRGEEGISVIEPGRPPRHLTAARRRVFDVSGAGDTVIATLAAGLVAGLDRVEALHLANLAAGIVVGEVGTAPITREQLLKELGTTFVAS